MNKKQTRIELIIEAIKKGILDIPEALTKMDNFVNEQHIHPVEYYDGTKKIYELALKGLEDFKKRYIEYKKI